jgi:hypothetical protein
VPDSLLCAQQRAPQVHREHLVERGDRQHVGVRRDLDAGVVDEVVDVPVLREYAVEHRRDLTLAGHVA